MKTGGLLKGILMSVLLVGGAASVCAQNEALVSSEEKTLLEKLSGNKRKIDWANMNIQFASSLKASFINREFDEAAFRVDRIRLEILGAFHNKFSYHFRQSFNQYTNPNIPLDNLSGSVELAVVNWNVSDRVTLSAGKQAVQLSGYEYWVSAIKVRQFSDFNNAIPCYQAGLNVSYALNPDQTMNFQVTNLRNGALEDQFMYGLPQGVERSKVPVLATANWDGFFVDRALQLRYSLSYGQLAKKKNIFYFTCGNVWDKKPFLGYIDLMFSREGLDSKGLLSGITVDEEGNGTTIQNVNYFTTIGNLDYRVNPHLNLYIKVYMSRVVSIKRLPDLRKEHTGVSGIRNSVRNIILWKTVNCCCIFISCTRIFILRNARVCLEGKTVMNSVYHWGWFILCRYFRNLLRVLREYHSFLLYVFQ